MELLRAVSLFSNCGAGDVGYRRAGFRFDVMAEKEDRRLTVALWNHPEAVGVLGDLRTTWPRVVAAYRKAAGDEQPALLAACPPCQGVSSAKGKRGDAEDPDAGSADYRNLLVLPIAEVAHRLKPRAIVVENVPAFLKRKVRHPETGASVSAARLLISLLESDYFVFPFLADLCHYGVPQTRRRAFLTFIRRDEEGLGILLQDGRAPYPQPTHDPAAGGERPVSVRSALRQWKLPKLNARTPRSARAENNRLHEVPVWQDHRYRMVKMIPKNSGNSAWQNDECDLCAAIQFDANAAVCRTCGEPLPRPVIQQEDGSWRLIKGFRTSSYKRMRARLPASTITTASGHLGSHSTIHPWANRVLSTLECALIQTFPRDFEWRNALDLWGHTSLRAMIGEAVPPQFTYLHGLAIRGSLLAKWYVSPLSRIDRRCVSARRQLLRSEAKDSEREDENLLRS